MSGDPKAARIDRFVAAVDELKVLMPEAHALVKDLRHLIKEANAVLSTDIKATMDAEVERQLQWLGKEVKVQMDLSVAKVETEFEKVKRLVLGMDKDVSLADVAKARGMARLIGHQK